MSCPDRLRTTCGYERRFRRRPGRRRRDAVLIRAATAVEFEPKGLSLWLDLISKTDGPTWRGHAGGDGPLTGHVARSTIASG
jgi:hypothetical protein